MPDRSAEPDPQASTRAARQWLEALQHAAGAGRAEEALAALREIEALAGTQPWCGVADARLMALGSLGPIAGRAGVPDVATLARRVEALAEPWFAADLDGFMEVAEGGRHAALNGLMHAAARSGDLDLAIAIRRVDEAATARAVARWAVECRAGSSGSHACYPTAYGAAQLIVYLVEKGRFADVEPLLDTLARLTREAIAEADAGGEIHDAFADEEARALACVLGAGTAPAALRARCAERARGLAGLAQPPERWPRTRSALARHV